MRIVEYTFSDDKYSGTVLFSFSDSRSLAIKWPYLNQSFQTKRKVSSIIGQALPGTILLAVVAIIFALIIGVFGGVLAALKQGFLVGTEIILVMSVIGMSGPSFFIAIMIAWIGGLLWYETNSSSCMAIHIYPWFYSLQTDKK